MDPTRIGDLASLPWQLQLVIASGYCAYLLAYVGIRRAHKPTDVVFASITFGVVAWFTLTMTGRLVLPVQALLAFSSALLAGFVWRRFLRLSLRRLLRKLNYSWSDETRSAWECLLENSRFAPTQLTVELVDGRQLICTRTGDFYHLPFGPFVLGDEGDVLIYVDEEEGPDGEITLRKTVVDDQWGANITHVPAAQIRALHLRLMDR